MATSANTINISSEYKAHLDMLEVLTIQLKSMHGQNSKHNAIIKRLLTKDLPDLEKTINNFSKNASPKYKWRSALLNKDEFKKHNLTIEELDKFARYSDDLNLFYSMQLVFYNVKDIIINNRLLSSEGIKELERFCQEHGLDNDDDIEALRQETLREYDVKCGTEKGVCLENVMQAVQHIDEQAIKIEKDSKKVKKQLEALQKEKKESTYKLEQFNPKTAPDNLNKKETWVMQMQFDIQELKNQLQNINDMISNSTMSHSATTDHDMIIKKHEEIGAKQWAIAKRKKLIEKEQQQQQLKDLETQLDHIFDYELAQLDSGIPVPAELEEHESRFTVTDYLTSDDEEDDTQHKKPMFFSKQGDDDNLTDSDEYNGDSGPETESSPSPSPAAPAPARKPLK